jgi:hypothetical protein
VSFRLADSDITAFAEGPVVLGLDHPNYAEETTLRGATIEELLRDLRG